MGGLSTTIATDFIPSVLFKLYDVLKRTINDPTLLFREYRSILSITAALGKPYPYRLYYIASNYLAKRGILGKYRDRVLADYMTVHSRLVKHAREEIGILRVQVPESIAARLSLILASMNRWTGLSMNESLIIEHRLSELLGVLPPPWADHGRLLDLASGETVVRVFPGSLASSWLIIGLLEYLKTKFMNVEVLLCKQIIDDYIDESTLRRLGGVGDVQIVPVDCSDPHVLLSELLRDNSITAVYNYVALLSLIDCSVNSSYEDLDVERSDSVIVGFNPANTPLEEMFPGKPAIVTTLREIIDLLSRHQT